VRRNGRSLFLLSIDSIYSVFWADAMMIKLDGGSGEAGGQIVRTALALSTLTGQPFTIANIRKGRPVPGLKAQHVTCVKALEKLCNAKSENCFIGSETLTYWPGKVKSQTLSVDIGTAGSITLLLQSLIIPAIFANGKVRLKMIGGTDVSWSPSVDYFAQVFLPHLLPFSEKIELKLLRRGYYPAGGGNVDLHITPKFKLSQFKAFPGFHNHLMDQAPKFHSLEQAHLIYIKGVSHASADLEQAQVAERQATGARQSLAHVSCPIHIRTEYSSAISTGSGITVWAVFSKNPDDINVQDPIILGGDALGEKGKRSEAVGKEAAEDLVQGMLSQAPIDEHLGDNLIPFLGLFGGSIKVSKLTSHTLTNIDICEKFLDVKFSIDSRESIISVASVGNV